MAVFTKQQSIAALTHNKFKKEVIPMAKITKLSHIYPKDIRAMSLLAKSGAISKDTLNKMNISNNRIKSYRQAGLIKEVYVPDKHGSTGRYFYELTDKQGKEFCRTHCDIKNFISNGNASVHNAKVSEYLANNLSKNELDSCMSEAELKPFIESRLQEYLDKQEYNRHDELLEALKNKTLSMPDIVYKTDTGLMVSIEVITDNYGNEEISAKEETATLLGTEITFVEAH